MKKVAALLMLLVLTVESFASEPACHDFWIKPEVLAEKISDEKLYKIAGAYFSIRVIPLPHKKGSKLSRVIVLGPKFDVALANGESVLNELLVRNPRILVAYNGQQKDFIRAQQNWIEGNAPANPREKIYFEYFDRTKDLVPKPGPYASTRQIEEFFNPQYQTQALHTVPASKLGPVELESPWISRARSLIAMLPGFVIGGFGIESLLSPVSITESALVILVGVIAQIAGYRYSRQITTQSHQYSLSGLLGMVKHLHQTSGLSWQDGDLVPAPETLLVVTDDERIPGLLEHFLTLPAAKPSPAKEPNNSSDADLDSHSADNGEPVGGDS